MTILSLRSIPVRDLFGKVVAFTGPMNGGKTKAVVDELGRANYSGFGYVAFNSSLNKRDGSSLQVNGGRGKTLEAISVDSPTTLMNEILRVRDKSDLACQSGEPVVYKGLTFLPDLPVKVVAIDELNLFTLDAESAHAMRETLQWAKMIAGLYVLTSGLDYDFRQEPFGHVRSLHPVISLQSRVEPVCQRLQDGEVCGDSAIHTQRLWSRDYVTELGLEEYFERDDFGFADKNHQKVNSGFVAAAYFDKTVDVENEADGRIRYIPVCDSCSELPFKDETHDLYGKFRNGLNQGALDSIRSEGLLQNRIVDFLLSDEEGWVQENNGLYMPAHYVKNRVGTFSRV